MPGKRQPFGCSMAFWRPAPNYPRARNKGVMLPLILVLLILLVAMPAAVTLIPSASSAISGFETMLTRLLVSLQQEMIGLTEQQIIERAVRANPKSTIRYEPTALSSCSPSFLASGVVSS